MPSELFTKELSLPKGWKKSIKSAVIHTLSLAFKTITLALGHLSDSDHLPVRMAAQLKRLKMENAQLKEMMAIKDARMIRLNPKRRPYYSPTERMRILELKSITGMSNKQAAETFLVSDITIASWNKRIDEGGHRALLQLKHPVNKFPDFVRYIAKRLKAICPELGKKKITQILARAGLHLAVTTVSRFIKDEDQDIPDSQDQVTVKYEKTRAVTAKYPNHLWHVDMSVAPTAIGFWVSWIPESLSQVWPFCWWFALVIDHYSRRCMGFALFRNKPTSLQVRQFLGRVVKQAGTVPKHLVCDQGTQFTDKSFKKWCKRKLGRKPRYGAVGEHGSIAVIERFIRTLKDDYLRKILIPYRMDSMRSEMAMFINWYNAFRPHETLDGATPIERYENSTSAIQAPRYEPRRKWPRKSRCAKPVVPVKGRRGVKLELVISFMDENRKLPVIELREAA